jgi:hypothetical protein
MVVPAGHQSTAETTGVEVPPADRVPLRRDWLVLRGYQILPVQIVPDDRRGSTVGARRRVAGNVPVDVVDVVQGLGKQAPDVFVFGGVVDEGAFSGSGTSSLKRVLDRWD